MSPKLAWLDTVVRLAITPVLLGALVLLLGPQRSGRDVAAAAGLILLGAVHLIYWSRPWHASQRRALSAAGVMVLTNFVLLHVLGLSEPLLWLYPALVVGAGLRPPAAVVGIAFMAVAAGAPLDDSTHVFSLLGPSLLGPGHAILLAVAVAGLGMVAVRQLITVNEDLHATKAELAELAVAAERERLARELHDVLGRTLSLIAVKAELAGRLRAGGDPSADAEIRDVQRLAREAIREVREAVAGGGPSLAAELVAAPAALRTAGIEASIDGPPAAQIDASHEPTVAWALREAVTNVVKHSGARHCRISLEAADGVTALEVVDDGHGSVGEDAGTGLSGLARRVDALGGTFEAGPTEAGGFRVLVRLGATPHRLAHAGAAR